jgi:hypothetical protein
MACNARYRRFLLHGTIPIILTLKLETEWGMLTIIQGSIEQTQEKVINHNFAVIKSGNDTVCSRQRKAQSNSDSNNNKNKNATTTTITTGTESASQLEECDDTSIIITSNLIPVHPSINMINETIHSVWTYLQGLSDMAPIFIACDGLQQNLNHTQAENDCVRYKQYEDTLRLMYPPPRFTIFVGESRLGLTGNVKQVMDLVTTEFVYVLQHDMPFTRLINHTAVIRVMRHHPDAVRLVRFNKRRNGGFGVVFDGIHLAKHHLWSDNNHLTRKSYYEEMFNLFEQ